MILAGDIGGTKTNLALFSYKKGSLELQFQKQFASREFTSFNEIIGEFKKLINDEKITKVSLGVAGPIIDGNCQTTNLPWDINSAELKEYFNISKVRLINDIEATAYGMLYLNDDDFIDLNPNANRVDANRAVIAAGTGLGEGMLFFDGKSYHPIASEGGHSDFAPQTNEQDELLKWLRKRYNGHVSFERILSGSGIYELYEFLLDSDFAPQPTFMIKLDKEKDKSATISKLALENRDPLCIKTLELFCEIYGGEAGNLALKTISLGGVYIGGGIAPKILPILRQNHFMNAFTNKGRFKEMLSNMQVRISLNEETALLGAGYFGAKDESFS